MFVDVAHVAFCCLALPVVVLLSRCLLTAAAATTIRCHAHDSSSCAAEGVNLENAASEVSEEAYSDVFEEDMPQPAADDDVSDAASVRSTSMSVHSPSDTLEQCVGKYTSPYTGKYHASWL